MAKLTATQVGAILGVTPYTIKRWYKFIEETDIKDLAELQKEGMPILPQYEIMGTNAWRFWNEEDIEQIRKFKEWLPQKKNGIMQKYNKGEKNEEN